jgi:hypothetical protein
VDQDRDAYSLSNFSKAEVSDSGGCGWGEGVLVNKKRKGNVARNNEMILSEGDDVRATTGEESVGY